MPQVWGAGCTVFELASGVFLFTGRSNSEMLHDMMKLLDLHSQAELYPFLTWYTWSTFQTGALFTR